jgi:hypothetical protein
MIHIAVVGALSAVAWLSGFFIGYHYGVQHGKRWGRL